jgi:transposase
VLVHDGIGIWLAARRLTREQLDALVLGLPWQRVGEGGVIGLT